MTNSTNFDFPTNSVIADPDGTVNAAWLQAMSRWHSAVVTLYTSGPTAQRPTKLLWIGRQYYDTDLGYPVWVNEVKPAVVWHNAAGAPV